jgi:hypothetical protein
MPAACLSMGDGWGQTMRRRVSECLAASPTLVRHFVAAMEGDDEVCGSTAWACGAAVGVGGESVALP